MKRRTFVQSAAAAIAAASSKTLFAQAPAVRTDAVKPVVVSSANGNVYKNGGPQTGVEHAFNLMTSGGKDVLEAVIAGVNLCELDPATRLSAVMPASFGCAPRRISSTMRNEHRL